MEGGPLWDEDALHYRDSPIIFPLKTKCLGWNWTRNLVLNLRGSTSSIDFRR